MAHKLTPQLGVKPLITASAIFNQPQTQKHKIHTNISIF
ncbi:hypothetical protein GARC_2657 [Paraglaciecola arctica BSs20135]|uniref:Uncharacterized protein n=1 Tax=Paraglaciecola arctica BSs20135 TaxID=493475 RepID=K6YSF5_9ALTE|nr:hypothetical protein GARC_2657 [Paraglaciecola arctica BSs20135]